jgi:hypothetical protein
MAMTMLTLTTIRALSQIHCIIKKLLHTNEKTNGTHQLNWNFNQITLHKHY